MKKTSKQVTVWTVAFLSLVLANAPAADENEATLTRATEQKTFSSDQSYAGAPAAYNKASGIIGMEVRNQNNQRLGKIRDVVFDLNAERVSYVVLGASKGRLGLDEKYLAVPMSAFKISADQKCLILNADKAGLAMATGFSKDNWPSVGNQSWGAEPFWQSDSLDNAPQYSTPAPAHSGIPSSPENITPGLPPQSPEGPTPVPPGVPPRAPFPEPAPPGER